MAVGRGTWASYQDHPCLSVAFRRARGYGASLSRVTIPVSVFPSGFEWANAVADELERAPQPRVPTTLSQAFGDEVLPLDLPPGLGYEGTLVLSEDPSHVVAVPGLVVVAIALEQADEDVPLVALTLADQRLFYARGALRRWLFNAQRADGAQDASTLGPGGAPIPLHDVAAEVVGSLWRKPKLSHAPQAWKEDRREVKFGGPFWPAVDALQRLVALGEVEDPCLRLDGTVALHAPGDGKVGWAPQGQGPNVQEIPEALVLDDSGRGIGHTVEKGWPGEYYLFVGGPTIASVAIDDWEPVLMVEGSPQLLSEQLVRKLTGDRFGLRWLASYVMLPSHDHGIEGIEHEVTDLLAAQAWRFWRLAGAELHEDGFYTGAPGPNAHLLPLLPRAETDSGRRRRITVERFGFAPKRRRLNVRVGTATLNSVRVRQLEIRRSAPVGAVNAFSLPASRLGPARGGSETRRWGALTLGDMAGGQLLPADLNRERVTHYLTELRRVEVMRLRAGELASRYEQTIADEARAARELGDGGVDEEALALAKQLVAMEKEAAPAASGEGGLREQFRRQGLAERARDLMEQAARRMRTAAATARGQRAAGGVVEKLQGAVFLKNLRRKPDAGARVVSHDLGVIQTSALAGTVADEGVHEPIQTHFIPRPVRVTFGAKLQPRIDQPPKDAGASTTSRPMTGDELREAATRAAQELTDFLGRPVDVTPQPGGISRLVAPEDAENQRRAAEVARDVAGRASNLLGFAAELAGFTPETLQVQAVDPFAGGQNVIPGVLTHREGYYASAWKRVAAGVVVKVDVDEVPLHRVLRIERPWQLLVALTGFSNEAELDKDAQVAATQLARRADEVRGMTIQAAGPWPVQCDGVVSEVEIVMELEGDVPLGFVTTITTGGQTVAPIRPQTRERRRA